MKCKVRNCDAPVFARGRCVRDYHRYRRSSSWLRLRRVFKRCDTCKVAMQVQHFSSNSHKKMERFKVLLAQDCITFTEIGNRLGFTPERARQIAKRFEVKGHKRRKVCTLNRHEMIRQQMIESSFFIQQAQDRAAQFGWTIEPLGKKVVVINGKTVRFGHLRQKRYLSVSGIRGSRPYMCDFAVFCNRDLWVIFPASDCPRNTTMFSETEPIDQRGMGKEKNHDYRRYINAWHYFEPRHSARKNILTEAA